jgi:hypothetical protein
VNEEMIDLFHEVIGTATMIISNPREKVVHRHFQGVFKVLSKASSLRANLPKTLESGSRRT